MTRCPRCGAHLARRIVAGKPELWCFACSREVAPNRQRWLLAYLLGEQD